MNRVTRLGLMGLLSLGSAVSLQSQAATDATEKSVEAAEQQWTQANNANDVALESTLLADNFFTVDSSGKVLNRDQFLTREKATRYTHAAIETVTVHMHGPAAVATYVFTAKGTDADGKPMDVHDRETDTWVMMPNGKLQCVASVGTPIKK